MKYNYCPICGEKLPPHHLGKLCKNCSTEQLKKKIVGTVVLTGVAAAAGIGAYYYVKNHKKEVKEGAEKLAGLALAYQFKRLNNEKDALIEVAKQAGKLLSR